MDSSILAVVFSRAAFIALAAAGGACSVWAMVLRANGGGSERTVKRWNAVAYGFMAVSMIVFIVAGFRSAG